VSQEPKQVIVIRSDLRTKNGEKLPKGKEGAQIAHAAMAFLTRRLKPQTELACVKFFFGDKTRLSGNFTPTELLWMRTSFRKIVLVAHDEEELLDVYKKAKEVGLEVHLITDSGYTCFDEPTNTCVGIGPDFPEKIDPITGHLKLR